MATPVPIIEGLAGKTATLERRKLHLDGRLAEKRTGASADFDKAEASALAAALDCMRYVAAVRGGL